MYLNREMYTYQDMECVGKMARPIVKNIANWLLQKVSIAE